MDHRKFRYAATEDGFTLLEVVVSVALLGLILGASFGLLGIGLGSLRTAQEYTRAVLLARQKLHQGSLVNLRPGSVDQGADGGYRWDLEVVPEEGGDELLARLFQLRVRVSWMSGAKERNLEMVTLLSSVGDAKLPDSVAPVAGDQRSRLGDSRRIPPFRGGLRR